MSRSALKGIQAAAGAAGGGVLYVEDVFSTYLWEGDGSEETVTNNIDLDGKEGLVWTKKRSTTGYHELFYKNSGSPADGTSRLSSNLTAAENNGYTGNLAVDFLSDGFSFGSTLNTSGTTFASWTFRKAPKFFDIVTYTGDGVDGRTVSHNLGSVPGCIIIKRTDASSTDWIVYHQQLNNGTDPEDYYLILNGTGAENNAWIFNKTAPTDTIFTVGSVGNVNASGGTYIAYLFAHNNSDGEFGEDGDQDIIKCGSYTGTGSYSSPPVIDLGFEPQWVMIKNTTSATDWLIGDVMRGATSQIIGSAGEAKILKPNSSNAEASYSGGYIPISPTATGFTMSIDGSEGNASGNTYIYMAIRRGPMKTPESGTEVFAIDDAANGLTSGFPVDWFFRRSLSTSQNYAHTRLCGETFLTFDSTDAEQASGPQFDNNTGVFATLNNSAIYGWMFRRAPGYFDVVAYTGNGTAGRTVNHNLGVTPELMIFKNRSQSGDNWVVYSDVFSPANYMKLNSDSYAVADSSNVRFNNTAPTDTVFTVGTSIETNWNGQGYISYHFATVAGVSKVGSYTGTGADLNVDCGFSAGARFILIKRSDSGGTGDWYIWDSVRGIVAGNDPYLLLNSTAAEVTSTDYIDPLSSGFTVTSSAPAALNASGGTYIFLAIA
jgi:hypothetical protein